MKWIAPVFFSLITLSATAQQMGRFHDETSAMMTDGLGQPLYTQQKYNWEGNVFFPATYTLATLTLINGKTYRNIRAKINLLENSLLFTDSANNEYAALFPISRIEFEGQIIFIKPRGDTALFQVLDSGRLVLLKKIYITSKDQVGYGSTTVTRVFEQKADYFVYDNTTVAPLDRSRSGLLKRMADDTGRMANFLDQEKPKLKKEADLVRTFRFYNSRP